MSEIPLETLGPGLVVQLKSGGPKMVVESASQTTAECVWFWDGETRSQKFLVSMLKAVPDQPGYTLSTHPDRFPGATRQEGPDIPDPRNPGSFIEGPDVWVAPVC